MRIGIIGAARRAVADATPEHPYWRSQHPKHRKLNTAMHP